MKFFLTAILAAGSLSAAVGPRLYYTDIDKGPSAPANGGNGAFITLYGARFGSVRNTSKITIGGMEPAMYTSWSDTKIVVRLGSKNTIGKNLPIVVTVAGQASNTDVSFTVDNTNNIFYFDPKKSGTSNDTCTNPANGSEASPWRYLHTKESMRSLSHYVNQCMSDGDIVYVRSGSIDKSDGEGWHSVLTFGLSGKNVKWIAVVAYPTESVTLSGADMTSPRTRFTVRDKATASGYIVAGFNIIGSPGDDIDAGGNVIELTEPGRIIGNHITGPHSCEYDAIGIGRTSSTNFASGAKIFGNEITGVATNCHGGKGASKLMHSIYAKCINCEIAWNNIHDNKTYNGVQIHYDNLVGDGGYYNISIHDNWIEGQYGSGINLSTIDFPTGGEYIRIYNNVLLHEGAVALAYNEPKGGQIKTCIALKDSGRPTASGTVEVYNNTMSDCSGIMNDSVNGWSTNAGALFKSGQQPKVKLQIRNNIVAAPAYYWTNAARGSKQLSAYIASKTESCCMPQISGADNLWSGDGAPPAATLGFLADPQFSGADFALKSTSPAIDAGMFIIGLATDRNGQVRPSGGAVDIGANEYQH